MEENDHSIIRAVLAGDKDAFAVLAARHAPTLFRVAYRITGNEADADDAVQESLLRAYRRLPDFELRSEFRTWIYRITVNTALNMINRKQLDTTQRIAEETDPELQQVQLADSAPGPERLLISHEIEAVHAEAMRSLTATERTAFVLRHMEDRSTAEIAEALSIAPNAAKQAVFRAVQKLRRHLAPLKVRRVTP
jgi:RNA polymerase sigma-70 factor (ECF subfamily)